MNECLQCPFCAEHGSFAEATEVKLIPGIVREFQARQTTVWRCSGCGSLHAKDDVDLGVYYEGYPFKKHKLDFWTEVAYRQRLKTLRKSGIKESQRILDFGCGAGVFVRFLKDQGFDQAYGYDAFVTEFNQPHLLMQKEAFDMVLAQDVLEHADDPEAMLQSMLACLKPDGLLYLGTPLADRIILKKPAQFAMSLHQPYHRHILSMKALRHLTDRHGLKEVALVKRHCTDTLVPTVNTRFLHEYIRAAGDVVDAGFEPPPEDLWRRNPRLIALAFLGYFVSHRAEVSAYYRKMVTPTL